ncbi:MAG: hypothetical protein LUF91_07240 [Oscillospiraceae bacterium]|nr:hypothetical protein [Oscillospiraceae bacterium]
MKTNEAAVERGFLRRELAEWKCNIVGDLWGGAVTTFALLPEVIGFMLVAGVHPYMGLYTSICLTVFLAFFGGRPAMISAGAGSTALVLAGLIREYGLTTPEYVFAAVMLAGAFQVVLGLCRVGSLVRFIPQSVMHGFVNGFALVILVSQLKLCIGRSAEMYLLIAAGIGIILLFPLVKKALPALRQVPESFAAIVLITAYALIFHSGVTAIGDMGEVMAGFQYVGYVFRHIGNIFTAECFLAVLPTAVSLTFVGLIESMLTARMVDEETHTGSNKNRECWAEGLGNLLCGALGAMPGCGMIAMTVTNLNAGGRGRLSQLTAGVLMAVLLFTLSSFMAAIPLAALCAVMFIVCFHTLDRDSILHAARLPVQDTIVMAMTAVVILASDNLALGVGVGVVMAALFHLLRGRSGLCLSVICLLLAAGFGVCGLLGAGWAFAAAMGFGALGGGFAAQGARSPALLWLCIAVTVAAAVGASVALHLGPWYTLIDSAASAGAGSTLYLN